MPRKTLFICIDKHNDIIKEKHAENENGQCVKETTT